MFNNVLSKGTVFVYNNCHHKVMQCMYMNNKKKKEINNCIYIYLLIFLSIDIYIALFQNNAQSALQ